MFSPVQDHNTDMMGTQYTHDYGIPSKSHKHRHNTIQNTREWARKLRS